MPTITPSGNVYTVYTFSTPPAHLDGTPIRFDLSGIFNMPGVASTANINLGWRILDTHDGSISASGPIDAQGRLLGVGGSSELQPGVVQPPWYFTDPDPYFLGVGWDVQVLFQPKPAKCCACSDDPTGQNSCPASDDSGDSVELCTGNFIFQEQLLSLFGLGDQAWNFGLNYQSNSGIEGLLGKGFAYPQYMYVEQLSAYWAIPPDEFAPYPYYNVLLTTDKLTQQMFVANSNGFDGNPNPNGYTLGPGNATGSSLTKVIELGTESFVLTAPNGTVTTFGPAGDGPYQIQSIVDRYGNKQTFQWVGTQLSSVTDSYGRVISYSYGSFTAGSRIIQITDYLNRQINFQYDADDHLIAVVTPSISKAAPGNAFPGGTAYVFQYDVGNANPFRQDALIKIWYPNQTAPYLNEESRTVDVEAVYQNATPRYQVTYGQNFNDTDTYGKVLTETLGDPENEVGGTATFDYTTCSEDLPANIIDSSSPIVSRTIYTDRNGNRTIYDYNANGTASRVEVDLNRNKNSLEEQGIPTGVSGLVTWTKFNAQNQPLIIVYPEGNSAEYTYENGMVTGITSFILPYAPRLGLLLSASRLPGNSIGVPSRAGSNAQTILTTRYFYDPLFNQLCASIDERGNPIDSSGDYFTPQNGGTPPSNANCSRYATLITFDYQKDTLDTISGDAALQAQLGLSSGDIQTLIAYVNTQMTATGGTGGIPAGFPVSLGNINGDGTGNGTSGLPDATHVGNIVQITHPSVLLVGSTSQPRIELFTVNQRGQITTATDPEGNLTVTSRYPESDPEGSGQNVSSTLSMQQYGLVREIHQDANPADVMSLVGSSGDLVGFTSGIISRTNTPGVYQDLVTRYEGSSSGSAGCVTCGYDAMGNVLNETNPRGFTTIYDRNEMGEVYRVTSPAPYNFKVETYYDANRNVTRTDTQDQQVQYNSPDPTASGYGTFTPSGSGTTAHVPMISGPGGALRPGWFSNLMVYDILDDKIEDDIDATGSSPANLITTYGYDANQNLILITKPEGNTVEYDYDERDLKIAERTGGAEGAIAAYSYDGNKNLINVIGPVDHNSTYNPIPPPARTPGLTSQTVSISDAFGRGPNLSLTGDWVLENTYDGFDRVVTATDAVGGVVNSTYDPTSTLIQKQTEGTTTGATPIDHTGDANVPLANSVMRYDEALRLYEQQQNVFMASDGSGGYVITHTGGGLATNSTTPSHTGTVTLTSGGSSYVLTRTIYDRSGRVSATLADNTAQTSYAYDGAGRRILVTDPLSNTVATQYDGNGNPVQVTQTEVCTITSPTVANEIFVSFTWFDCLNRPVVVGTQGADGYLTSNLNLCCPWQGLPSTLFSLMGYDSRGNTTTVTDPKSNVVVSLYDGASRLIETQQEMRQNGDGRNAPEPNQTFLTPGGIIRTEYVYDGNGRLVELVDDRGASTVYAYDLLDRLITKTLADGSVSMREYDLSSCLAYYTDENGSFFAMTFDALSRKISTICEPAGGVVDVGTMGYLYDGLSRSTQYQADGGASVVQLVYDSLGRTLADYQGYDGISGIAVRTAWTSLVPTQVTYPNNITATNAYDLLYRRISVAGAYGATALDAVAWQFFGPQRTVETNYGSDSLIATQMNNARTHSAVQAGVPLPAWGDDASDQLGYDGAGR